MQEKKVVCHELFTLAIRQKVGFLQDNWSWLKLKYPLTSLERWLDREAISLLFLSL